MSMVTSCPACTTTFRVTPEQLQAMKDHLQDLKRRGIEAIED